MMDNAFTVKNAKQILLKIKTIITEKEIKKKDLAQKLNLSQSALTSRLNQDNISIEALLEICNALNIDMNISFINKDDTK
jgi:DNA-binding Xre family transcriptional regulator|nr:MAG TPA: SOS-response transcriptional repressor [Caudoviricetes sp.]DAZ51674.1 MAG TPA: SOS-response transcriptional repressor [Caudoviricetes sp.]